MELRLTNTLSLSAWTFEVTDIGDYRLYYHFEDFQLPDGIPDGQYTYELWDSEEMKGKGLLQIGDYKNNAEKYDTDNDQRIIYNG